jgi:CBS domain-containing protein
MMLEFPTLRLATLRRLVAHAPPPLVFACDTPIAIVEEALAELPFAKVVLVDAQHALCGVMVAGDLPTERASGVELETVMDTRIVFLAPEHDVEAALATLRAHQAEHVVVTLAGELLGVLSRADLERAHGMRRAA